jgi:hypothetical protein
MPVCSYHPDRPGVGVCMRCQKVICSACCTRVDGVNHCHACLKALGSKAEESRPALDLWPLLSVVLLGVGGMLLVLLCWMVQGALAP